MEIRKLNKITTFCTKLKTTILLTNKTPTQSPNPN